MSHDTDRIEADINQSRHRLNDTIEQLGSKLSPGQMLDEALGLVRGQAGEVAGNLGRQIKDNPMPAVLIAAGVVWMIASKTQQHQQTHALSAHDWETERGYRTIEETRLRLAQRPDENDEAYFDRVHGHYAEGLSLKQKAGEAADAFKRRVRETIEGLERRATDTRDRIGQTFAGMGHMASNAGHMAHDQARYMGQHASDAASSAKHRAESFYEENPLAAGAIAMAIGALIGSAAPLTNAERGALGDVADKALDKGAQLAERGAQEVERRVEALH